MRVHCRKCGRDAPSNATGCNCGGENVITLTDLRVRGKRIGAFTIPHQRDGNFWFLTPTPIKGSPNGQ